MRAGNSENLHGKEKGFSGANPFVATGDHKEEAATGPVVAAAAGGGVVATAALCFRNAPPQETNRDVCLRDPCLRHPGSNCQLTPGTDHAVAAAPNSVAPNCCPPNCLRPQDQATGLVATGHVPVGSGIFPIGVGLAIGREWPTVGRATGRVLARHKTTPEIETDGNTRVGRPRT